MRQLSIRIYYEDTDTRYVNYLKYIEQGRNKYREKYGII